MTYLANVSASIRWPGWRPRGWAADVALALAVATFQVAGTFATADYDDEPQYLPLDWIAVLLLLAGPLALAARRRWPLAVLAVSLAATNAYLAREYSVGSGTALIAMFVAIYSAATTGSRLRSLLVFLVSSGSFIATLRFFTGQDAPTAYAVFAGMVLAVVAIGEAARAHRELRAEAEERAVEAERTRDAEARRRVDEERLRIARELHDVLSHSISMMNVQAGVAAHLLDEKPEQARTALVAIKGASKDALRELRATLGTLRQVDEVEGGPPRTPAPGLALLDELVARTTAAGLAVDVRTDGQPRELPDGVDLAAYRIVQEALTNVTRHAGPATAAVLVRYGEHDLYVQVDDDGRGDHETVAGHGTGIVGMRERAETLGGELQAGPGPDGGFRVRARLPLDTTPGGAQGRSP